MFHWTEVFVDFVGWASPAINIGLALNNEDSGRCPPYEDEKTGVPYDRPGRVAY
jgi:hypothetical protein